MLWLMEMDANNLCCHEEEIQHHSRKIEALEVRADYKDKRIDELNDKIEKMDSKLDAINNNVNQLILNSNSNDKELEIRLKAIETELELQKQNAQNHQAEINTKIAYIGVACTIVTIAINIIFNLIH